MKSRVWSLFVALLVVAMLLMWHREDRAQQQTAIQNSRVDTQGLQKYLLGPGDVLEVKIFGQPDMTSRVAVDGEGNISSLPFIDPVRAQCRGEREVQKDIANAYAVLFKHPQVSVQVVERNSQPPAAVFGEVKNPTRVQMIKKVRLNEIVAASGGFTERASGTIQILHTEPLLCPAPGEEAEAAPIDGVKMPFQLIKIKDLRAGKPEGNPLIRPGDYIIVTEAEPVYVTGSVAKPQTVYARDQLTLSLALAMSGGVKKEAKSSAITIHRLQPGSNQWVTINADLTAIRKRQQPDVFLQAFDVIDVPEAGPLSPSRFKSTLAEMLFGSVPSRLMSLPL